ncbi:hypothetical protein BH20CHL6_BH20CHL6_09670 [soil metagenome]
MTDAHAGFVSRLERFESVDSTQRVVREWLEAGVAEVPVAVADLQTAGRGRQGRGWTAPSGRALMVSCGFRPRDLHLRHGWRLAAIAALAMLDASEEAAGLLEGTLFLKWPNDLVAEDEAGPVRKLAGVLGETVSRNEWVESAVVGLGVNADWPAADFPPELAASMTSLRDVAGGRPIDRAYLLGQFLDRLEPRYEALQAGRFDAAGWTTRQVTTGRTVEVTMGAEVIEGVGAGVDPQSGGLLVERAGGLLTIDSGEVTRCRVMATLPRPTRE